MRSLILTVLYAFPHPRPNQTAAVAAAAHFNRYGIKVEAPEYKIDLAQSQVDRSKTPFAKAKLASLHWSRVVKPGDVPQVISVTTVGKLHFQEPTSNNHRGGDQRYFNLVVQVVARLDGISYPLVSHRSGRLVVRASNPKQFSGSREPAVNSTRNPANRKGSWPQPQQQPQLPRLTIAHVHGHGEMPGDHVPGHGIAAAAAVRAVAAVNAQVAQSAQSPLGRQPHGGHGEHGEHGASSPQSQPNPAALEAVDAAAKAYAAMAPAYSYPTSQHQRAAMQATQLQQQQQHHHIHAPNQVHMQAHAHVQAQQAAHAHAVLACQNKLERTTAAQMAIVNQSKWLPHHHQPYAAGVNRAGQWQQPLQQQQQPLQQTHRKAALAAQTIATAAAAAISAAAPQAQAQAQEIRRRIGSNSSSSSNSSTPSPSAAAAAGAGARAGARARARAPRDTESSHAHAKTGTIRIASNVAAVARSRANSAASTAAAANAAATNNSEAALADTSKLLDAIASLPVYSTAVAPNDFPSDMPGATKASISTEDVQKCIPSALVRRKVALSDGTAITNSIAVDQNVLVAVLVASVQQLKDNAEAMTMRMVALETKNKFLLAQISYLALHANPQSGGGGGGSVGQADAQ